MNFQVFFLHYFVEPFDTNRIYNCHFFLKKIENTSFWEFLFLAADFS